jgi:hypothetical protein
MRKEMINMLNTKQFHHNLAHKIFSTTCAHVDFPVKFIGTSIGNIIEVQSQWTEKISKWEVVGFRERNGTYYSAELHPTKETIQDFPKLQDYKMIVYRNGYKKR